MSALSETLDGLVAIVGWDEHAELVAGAGCVRVGPPGRLAMMKQEGAIQLQKLGWHKIAHPHSIYNGWWEKPLPTAPEEFTP